MIQPIVLFTFFITALCQAAPALTPTAELGKYDKAKTQFNGITSDEYVTYLRMNPDQYVNLPVLSTGKVNVPLNMTVSFWFKIYEEIGTQTQMLFGLPKSLQCYLVAGPSVMCNTGDRVQIQVTSDEIQPGKWIHLVISFNSSGTAFLMLSDAQKVLDLKTMASGFNVIQSQAQQWSVCIGSCLTFKGFNGGIREFIIRSQAMKSTVAFHSAHKVFDYSNDIKCYFRFSSPIDGDFQSFNADEYVEWTWQGFYDKKLNLSASIDGSTNLTVSSLIGQDIIPNDICPITEKTKEFVVFDQNSQLFPFNLDEKLKKTKFAYTISVTLAIDETTCSVSNPTEIVQSNCHIIFLKNVFALYFERPNMARLRFYAAKNYYEISSKSFFVPFNQFVTIQISFDQIGGYKIVVLDLNGTPVSRQTVKQSLQAMDPNPELTLFQGMSGVVDRFILCKQAYSIPIDEAQLQNCTVDLSGQSSNFVDMTSLANAGTRGGNFVFGAEPTLKVFFYENGFADFNTTRPILGELDAVRDYFDGIACDNDGNTVLLQDADSYFMFQIYSEENLNESTVEFWFKPYNPDNTTFDGNKTIFQVSNQEHEYFDIYMINGTMYCQPFDKSDLKVSVTGFDLDNTDQWGWWHVSCGFHNEKQLQMTLYNEKVNLLSVLTLNDTSLFLNFTTKLAATVGRPVEETYGPSLGSFMIKELRFWNTYQSADQISSWRRMQIDPTLKSSQSLISYYRLGADLNPYNFARLQKDYPQNQTDHELWQAKLVSDAIVKTNQVWNDSALEYTTEQENTYHAVCPLYTYLHDNMCYSEPINQLILTAIPVESTDNKLYWEFSTLYSSAILQKSIPLLVHEFYADDSVVQGALQLQDGQKENGVRSLPSSLFRQENKYTFGVQVTNLKQIAISEKIKFIPKICKWFEAKGSDAKNGQQIFFGVQGAQELSFILTAKNLQGCEIFEYYDALDTVNFEFILFDDDQYMQLKPRLVFEQKSDGSIIVTIPMKEQYKFPIRKDVKIVMSISWKSQNIKNYKNSDNSVFQNLIYTVRFEPPQSELVTSLVANANLLYPENSLILDASGTLITGLSKTENLKQLKFQWVCPASLESICENKNKNILNISYEEFIAATNSTQFGNSLQFSLQITWFNQTGTVKTQTLKQDVTWLNVPPLAFQLTTDQKETLISKSQAFRVTSPSIRPAVPYYRISWDVQPPVDISRITQLEGNYGILVSPNTFDEETSYTVTATVFYKTNSTIKLSNSIQFTTTQIPKGGIVQLVPKKVFEGDAVTITVKDWTSKNGEVTWILIQSEDAKGLKQGIQHTKNPKNQGDFYQFKAELNPVIVIITDAKGEQVVLVQQIPILRQCVEGEYLDDEICKQCPAGYKCPDPKSKPEACQPGEFSAQGQTKCGLCNAGTFSGATSSNCSPCKAGQTSLLGSSSCSTCKVNTFSAVEGSPSCTSCQLGFVSSEGATTCQSCAAGTFRGESDSECNTCVAGTHSTAGSSVCADCPAGTFSKALASQCTPCDAGTFSVAPRSKQCTYCAVGTYQDQTSQTSCKPCSTAQDTGSIICVEAIVTKPTDTTVEPPKDSNALNTPIEPAKEPKTDAPTEPKVADAPIEPAKEPKTDAPTEPKVVDAPSEAPKETTEQPIVAPPAPTRRLGKRKN